MNYARLETHADPVHVFVVEVLRTGLMLTDLMADLIEITPEDAFPGRTRKAC